MLNGFRWLVTMFVCSLFYSNFAHACTDFRLIAKDGTVFVTRSLEFSMDFKSNIHSSNQGRAFDFKTPEGKQAIKWNGKFGYVYLDGLGIDAAIDGMNEKGLSFEALYLPTLAQYQPIAAGKEAQALPYIHLGDWILSNFASVDEVRTALPNITVFSELISGQGSTVFPLHFAVYDAAGKGIVIEYVAGKLAIYENKIGVMTNSPTYDWHTTNLNNYINLIPNNPNPVMLQGITFAATGQGFGMLGLPGDISPPSRFVKIATLLRVIIQPENAVGALNMSEHIINNVDIPYGLAREATKGDFTNDVTQWVVFKDLTHRIFYYRTYFDLALHAVTLTKVNFAANAPRFSMPIAGQETVQDMTPQFMKSINQAVPSTSNVAVQPAQPPQQVPAPAQ